MVPLFALIPTIIAAHAIIGPPAGKSVKGSPFVVTVA